MDEKFEAYPRFTDFGDYRLRFESNMRYVVSNNLNLNFDGTTGKLSNDNFGIATEKLGHRIIQLAIKFYF